ncbi:MAG: alpha/beta hydrolase [Acidimicrobiales bacterium]
MATTESPTRTAETRTVSVWNGRISLRVQVKGAGSPIVYLHPGSGMDWDPFLDGLAADHTIYAPELPGTSDGDPDAIHQIDDVFDLVLVYEEAVRALGLEGAVVIGQSFGGMLAAELAACFPALFSRVVLLDPAGLWFPGFHYSLDVLMAGPPEGFPGALFHNPMGPAAWAMFAPPADPEAAVDSAVQKVWNFGCCAKFMWPIPDRGLEKRLHRVSAPTLVLWGENDRLIPVAYAQEFGRRIAGSQVVVVPQCGHIPQVEQRKITTTAIRTFLADPPPPPRRPNRATKIAPRQRPASRKPRKTEKT